MALLLLTAALSVPYAAQAAADPCSPAAEEVCARGSNGGFAFGQSSSQPGRAPLDAVLGATVGSGIQSAVYTETRYVPTCQENDVGGEDLLCTAATATCPTETEIRFWVYTREVTRATSAATEWMLRQDPPFVCRGAQDPEVVAAVDPAVLIAAIVQRDFQRVVVLKGVAEVSPRPDTLVNIPTRFTTEAPASYDIPLTLLGQAVTITATAQRWTWHFGDGASASTTAVGTQGRVEHVYSKAAPLGAHVVIEWSGAYRIGAGPALPITGTATTTGEPTAIAVKEARSQLVDGSR